MHNNIAENTFSIARERLGDLHYEDKVSLLRYLMQFECISSVIDYSIVYLWNSSYDDLRLLMYVVFVSCVGHHIMILSEYIH